MSLHHPEMALRITDMHQRALRDEVAALHRVRLAQGCEGRERSTTRVRTWLGVVLIASGQRLQGGRAVQPAAAAAARPGASVP